MDYFYCYILAKFWLFEEPLFLFATYWDMQRIRGSTRMRYMNLLLLTYLLTYTGQKARCLFCHLPNSVKALKP